MVPPDRIAMVTLVTSEYQFFEPSVHNKLDYCAVHGHDLQVGREVFDRSRHPVWTKLHLIREYLPGYDWLFWSDADAVVTDFSVSLGEVLARAQAAAGPGDFYVTQDRLCINLGHFFIRNCPGAFQLLDLALARTDTLDHGWHEQEAIVRTVAEYPHLLKCRRAPQRTFNSYPRELGDGPEASWAPGDFICHCPGHWKHLFVSTLQLPNVLIPSRDAFGELFKRLGYGGEGAEIGVEIGRFSRVLRAGWPAGRLHLVDRWAYVPWYRDGLNAPQPVHDARHAAVCLHFASDPGVSVHRADSVTAAASFPDRSLDWVYIDADHSYEAVTADLHAWWPKVRRGGLVGGHDYVPDGDVNGSRYGVKRAVKEFLPTVPARPEPYVTREPEWPSWYVIKRGLLTRQNKPGGERAGEP